MPNYNARSLSFFGLQTFMGNKESKKLAHNTICEKTWIYDENYNCVDAFAIVYHRTTIAIIGLDFVQVNTSGYRTSTTKERLNDILGDNKIGYISQQNFVWYINGLVFEDKMAWRGGVLQNAEKYTKRPTKTSRNQKLVQIVYKEACEGGRRDINSYESISDIWEHTSSGHRQFALNVIQRKLGTKWIIKDWILSEGYNDVSTFIYDDHAPIAKLYHAIMASKVL